VLLQAGYFTGYKRALTECRADLRVMAARHNDEVASLRDEFQTMQLALLFNSPHFDEGKPEPSRLN
jgi:hypothetical protein